MVSSAKSTKERIVALLDELPEDSLSEVVSFLEFQRYKRERADAMLTSPRPVKLGGLWAGVNITDEDIEAVRREMWGGIEERFK
jgi:hypothetical protein